MMREPSNAPAKRRADPGHSLGRTLAAVIGAPLSAAAAGAALARCLPLSREWSAAWGYHLLVPAWVLLACVLPLQRSGKRAWLLCAAIIAPAIAALSIANMT